MVCGRFSHRIYIAYSTVYTLGTLLSMQERMHKDINQSTLPLNDQSEYKAVPVYTAGHNHLTF